LRPVVLGFQAASPCLALQPVHDIGGRRGWIGVGEHERGALGDRHRGGADDSGERPDSDIAQQ
jgi:hypothetical protein